MVQFKNQFDNYQIDLVAIVKSLAFECAIDEADVEMVIRRFRNEGLTFLTKALPMLSKAIICSLEKGYFDRPTNFAWKGKSLKSFQSMLGKIFLPSGKLRNDADALAIKLMRQFCEYFYKLSIDFSEQEIKNATEKFIAVDNSVPSSGEYDQVFVDSLRKDFETNYKEISTSSVQDIVFKCPPRSGSGTYSNVQPSEYRGMWSTRRYLDQAVPQKWENYAYSKRLSPYTLPVPIKQELDVSQVLFVPKDSRGPRTIVREPFLSLGFQMSYFDFMSSNLEHISHHRINFQDQTINNRLAQQSSIDRKLTTLDLKEASDRVSFAIMRHIFRYSPGPLHFILNRTGVTQLPDKNTHELRKLAGMGSGLTFPTMSLLCHLAIARETKNRTGHSYDYIRRQIYVYGDDIIVPSEWYSYSVDALKRVALTVNEEKSFKKGFFRESCGGDYFKGSDVGFVRCKLSSSKVKYLGDGFLLVSGDNALSSLDAHCAELMKNGLHQVAEVIYKVIEAKHGKLPFKANDCNAVARYVSQLPDSYFNSNTEYKGIRCIVGVPVETEVCSEEFFLTQALRDSKCVSWDQKLFPEQFVQHSHKAIPRKRAYRRMKVSPLALA